MDIVFVSSTQRTLRPYYDPSTRYRSFNLAEHFRRAGKRVLFLSQDLFEADPVPFDSARILVFHRPKSSEILMDYLLANADRQRIISDYDDLVFDVSCTGVMPAVLDRGEDYTEIARLLASTVEVGAMIPHRTASTHPLGARADRVMGGETVVIHNGLDPVYLDLARAIFESRAQARPEYDLGYFSGTASHNKDFQSIALRVAQYLEERPTARMLLVGPVALPSELVPVADRIIQERVRSFHLMPALLASCRMVLGPLLETEFNACKSGLKFFEAGVLGVSVAATPIPDIDRFDSPLLHKCRTPDEWDAALRAPGLSLAETRAAVAALRDEAALTRQADTWSRAFLDAC